jgi:uncharacterized membrane protein
VKLITVEVFYTLMGALFALIAIRIATGRERSPRQRWLPALFWALLAVVFLFGRVMPPLIAGYLVLATVVLAAGLRDQRPDERGTARADRLAESERLQNRLFWPALIVPGTAVLGTLLLDKIHIGDVWLIDPKQATLISLGLGAVLALGAAIRTTGARVSTAGIEGGRLVQAIGWALILPQMLAVLGGIFAQSGVGDVVAGLVARALPTQLPFVAVAAYCFGMLLFTICMGNAFAAFAVITSGIGVPLVVMAHGGNPAIMAAIGMLSGYCGTLLTPMAANFNLVPAMLLDLRDKYAIIRAQVPLAAAIFTANVLLMYFCVYRF